MQSKAGDYKPINKQFMNYIIPAVVAQAVQAFYYVLNGIIAGQGLGEVALEAVNIALPFNMIIFSTIMLIGVGGANVYSFYKGKGDTEKANNIFCQCMAILVAVGVVMALTVFYFRGNLAVLLGANKELMPFVTAYLKWLAPCTLLQMIIFGLIVFIRNDDAPRLVMAASIVGAVVNVILDVVFILILYSGSK